MAWPPSMFAHDGVTHRIQWDPQYATGDAEIDSQHKELLAFADALFRLSAEDAKHEILDDAFRTLFAYMDSHFRKEEAHWEAIGSRFIEAQRIHHTALREELQGIWEDDRIGNFSETLAMLFEWLHNRLLPHIVHQDTAALEAR